MSKKLLLVSQLFPSKALPNLAVYNLRKFRDLANHFEVQVAVPVPWIDWLRFGSRSRESASGLDILYFPFLYTPKVGRRFYPVLMRLSFRLFARKLLSPKPDAIVVSWAFPDGVAIAKLASQHEIPFVVQVLGSDVYVHCSYEERRKQVLHSMQMANAVTTVSRALKKELIDMGVSESNVHVSYNGVDHSRFSLSSRVDAKKSLGLDSDFALVLYVGNLKESKGVYDLIEAYRMMLGEDDTKVALVFVGGGECESGLDRKAQRLASEFSESRVTVQGPIPNCDLGIWFNAADVVCLPSYSEGVPNVLTEAMSCGTPIVSTDVGGIGEVVTDEAGILVPPGEPKVLGQALREALDRDWDRRLIYEHSLNFDWDNHAMEVAEIIRESCFTVSSAVDTISTQSNK